MIIPTIVGRIYTNDYTLINVRLNNSLNQWQGDLEIVTEVSL